MEIAELRTVLEAPSAKALQIHAQLAEELSAVSHRCEEQRRDLWQAIEVERSARAEEVSNICSSLHLVSSAADCSSHMIEGKNTEICELPASHPACRQVATG